MFSRSVGITAICASAVHALLLPPGTDNDLLNPLVDPKARSIQVPCSACHAAAEDDYFKLDNQLWMHSSYEVNLAFRVSNDGERLEIDGEAIYPPPYYRETYSKGNPIYVTQISPSGLVTPLQITGSGYNIESERPISEEGDAMILLEFQIGALNGQSLPGFPKVAINLLQLNTGELFIVTIDVPKQTSIPLPMTEIEPKPVDDEECPLLPSLLCQWRRMLLKTFSAIRNGRFGSAIPCSDHEEWVNSHFDSDDEEIEHDAYDGQAHHINPSWDEQSPRRNFTHTFARSVVAVLIPIVAGITVGLFASFLGLVAGRLISWLWINVARKGRRGPYASPLEESDYNDDKTTADGAIVSLVYEDAPAYEDIEREPR